MTWCLAAGIPVISADCKKKELAGNFKNGGAGWQPKGSPRRVNDHGFADKELGKVAPYGIYDLAANSGWMNVGTGHETAAFAVESIRRWWKSAGAQACPGARQLLITADCGGSNGSRRRLWKVELAKPPRPGSRSPSPTCRRAPASGTKSSTGCSRRSP